MPEFCYRKSTLVPLIFVSLPVSILVSLLAFVFFVEEVHLLWSLFLTLFQRLVTCNSCFATSVWFTRLFQWEVYVWLPRGYPDTINDLHTIIDPLFLEAFGWKCGSCFILSPCCWCRIKCSPCSYPPLVLTSLPIWSRFGGKWLVGGWLVGWHLPLFIM